MTSSRATIILFIALVASATAFAPAERTATSYVPMKRVGFAAPPPSTCYQRNANSRCQMTSDAEAEAAKLRAQAQKLREEAAAAAGVSVEELAAASKKNSDGTVYDDEPMLEPPRENLSSSMKERLRREAATGLDSNQASPNTILYISAAVVVLVALGGKGILF